MLSCFFIAQSQSVVLGMLSKGLTFADIAQSQSVVLGFLLLTLHNLSQWYWACSVMILAFAKVAQSPLHSLRHRPTVQQPSGIFLARADYQ